MAIYHLEIKTHGRDQGRNAIRLASYRAGERLLDETTDRIYDYSRKKEVVHSEILAPASAPEWVADRSRLWHEVEKREIYINARLCREFVVALPNELSKEQNIALVQDFIVTELTAMGMIVDYAIHAPHGNIHAHLLSTTRHVSGAGFGKKNRDWDAHANVGKWRQAWAETTNRHLAMAGFGSDTFIDHRTLEDQGIDRLPTVHIGRATPSTTESHERKQVENAHINAVNAAIITVAEPNGPDTLRAEIGQLESSLASAELMLTRATNAQKTAVPARRIGSREYPSKTVNPSFGVNTLDAAEQAEFQARAAFILSLGRPPYSIDKYRNDCARMAAQPGGSRLRWWLYSFKEASAKYSAAYGLAISYAPLDIQSWMGNCWKMLGEQQTWEQFNTVESAFRARMVVAWPKDAMTAPHASQRMNSSHITTAQVRGIARDVPSVKRYLSGRIEVMPDGCSSQNINGILLYSKTPEMQVYEMNVKSALPNAEHLFLERKIACRQVGRVYTWAHFYADISRMHGKGTHTDMVDWWFELHREAKNKGILDGQPSKTLFLRTFPDNIKNAIRYRQKRSWLPCIVPSPDLIRVMDDFTTALQAAPTLTSKMPYPRVTDSRISNDQIPCPEQLGTDLHYSSMVGHASTQHCAGAPTMDYPTADIPVWTLPSYEPR